MGDHLRAAFSLHLELSESVFESSQRRFSRCETADSAEFKFRDWVSFCFLLQSSDSGYELFWDLLLGLWFSLIFFFSFWYGLFDLGMSMDAVIAISSLDLGV